MNIEDRDKRQEEIIKVIEAANTVARAQTYELKKLSNCNVAPMIETGYAIDHVNGEPVFCFEIKSQDHGIPFGYENVNAALITIAQAVADAYAEFNSEDIRQKVSSIQQKFKRKVLLSSE